MKILFISTGDCKYGASKSLLSLMITLKEKYNVIPVLLTKKKNELSLHCKKNGIEHHNFWYCDIMAGAPYNFFLTRALKHIVKYLLFILGSLYKPKLTFNPSDFDIIHTNHNRIGLGTDLSKKYKIPHIWHLREFGEEDYNVIVYKHNYIQYMNSGADYFVSISDAVGECWAKKGIDKDKIIRIYNGIDSSSFIPKKNRKDSLLKLVISGHVQPNKGQLTAVEALGYLPEEILKNVSLDIIGDAYSDYKNIILKKIRTLKLEKNVSFLPYEKNIPGKLSEYDIGITCSKSEGFGRVTVEYMLAELVTIASDTGANPELVEDGKTGLLFKYNDPVDLAEKILYLYKNKKELERISTLGYSSGHSKFSNEEYVDNIYKIYESVLMPKKTKQNVR